MPGMFITFEGIEGVGKTTQIKKTFELLSSGGGHVLLTREPGGTEVGEAIRNVMLHSTEFKIEGMTELLLLFAARHQHLQDVIKPALSANKTVLCDRFTDATFAYQGGGRGLDRQVIAYLQERIQGELRPHMTFLLDAPEETGLGRARNRSEADRFEAQTLAFFKRVRQSYLSIAKQEPGRVHIINAARGIDEVQQEIREILSSKGLC